VEFRRTKIICTIGPATASYEMLASLHKAGMNVVQLNMSHADHESAAKIVNCRTLNRRCVIPSQFFWTIRPGNRTGDMAQPMELKPATSFR
jgi:pyruvate kinase